jgi:hypothetical protein
MIRINLLKPLQLQASSINLQEPGNKRKKFVLVGAGIVVILLGAVALLQYPSLLGGLLSGTEKAEAHPA